MKNNKVFMMVIIFFFVQGINAQRFVIDNFSKETIKVRSLWKNCKEGSIILKPNGRSKVYDSSVNPVESVIWEVGDGVQYSAIINGSIQKLVNGNFVILERGKFQQNLRVRLTGSKIEMAESSFPAGSVLHVLNRTDGLIRIASGGRDAVLGSVSEIGPNVAITYSRDLSGLHWNQDNTHYFIAGQLGGQDIEIVGPGVYKRGSDGKQYKADIIP